LSPKAVAFGGKGLAACRRLFSARLFRVYLKTVNMPKQQAKNPSLLVIFPDFR